MCVDLELMSGNTDAAIAAIERFEEAYLEQKFGDAYRRYKARVPRWL